MPIPFLSSIGLNKNEVQDFKVFNLASDPTLTSGGDYGYFWLNTSGTKTLKFWDGASIRSLIDSTTISSSTAGSANDLTGGLAGSLPYQQAAGDTTFLGIGTANQVLSVNGGATAPQWLSQSSLSVGSATNKTGGSVGDILVQSGSGVTGFLNVGTAGQVVTSNGVSPQYVDQSTLSVGSATTAGSVTNSLTAGTYLTSGGTYNGSVARTFAVDATDANTASKVVARDASGNFSAGTITAAKVTGLSAPTAGSDAANRDYVDSVAQGLDVKASCKAATVSNINLASPGATIDTVSLSVDNRVLVKDQSAPAENGIYLWKGAAVAMVRSPDADTWDDLVGAFTFVEEGTAANADSGWVCTVNAGGTLGSTAVTFVKFSQAGSYTAGNGIVQSGTSFNFAQSTPYTAGQIPFASSTTAMGFNANLHWDNGNNRLGIGTATPGYNIDLTSSGDGYGRQWIASQSFIGTDNGTAGFQIRVLGGGTNGVKISNAANNTEYLRIASDGVCTWSNVGGVAGERMKLDVGGLGIGVAPTNTANARRLDIGGSLGAYLTLSSTSSSANARNWAVGANVNAYGDFAINQSNAKDGDPLAAGTTRLAIDLSGNVGIGTATPAYKLSVNGRISYIGAIGEGADTTLSSSSTGLLHGNSSYWTEHRFYASGNEQHRIAQSGVFTWYDGAGGTRMTLNGTGLGVGVSPNTILHVRKDFAGYTTIKAENQHTIAAGTGISFTINDGGTDASWFRRHRDGTGNTDIGYNAALRFRGQVTATERTDMVIDTSGNVGIGTATPSISGGSRRALTLNSPSGQLSILELAINGTLGGYLFSNGSITTLNSQSTAPLTFETNGAERARIDSSGNLGLGVTPTATWDSSNGRALQLNGGSIYSYSTSQLNVLQNAFFDGSAFKYVNAAAASGYRQISGAHSWYVAASGSAGASIGGGTWSAAMTLTAAGSLAIGQAGSSSRVTIQAASSGNDLGISNANLPLCLKTGGGSSASVRNMLVGHLYTGSDTDFSASQIVLISANNVSAQSAAIALTSNNALAFYTAGTNPAADSVVGTERLRIKSTGQVNFFGLASDPAGAAGDVVYNSTSNRLKYHNGTAWVNTGTNKYSGALAGTGTSFTVTHNLGTRDVTVAVRKSGSTYDQVFTDVQMTTDNTVTIVFASSVTGSDYTVTVIG